MKRTETFQNLLVISFADGEISESEKAIIQQYSYQLGITDEEYEYYIKNLDSLDFIIPKDRDEAYNELYKMIILCMSDGELQEEEEDELYYFATEAGFTEEEFEKIVEHTLSLWEAKNEERKENNKKQYEWAVESMRLKGISDKNIADAIKNIIKSKDLNYSYSPDSAINHSFYCYLWLYCCRYIKINPRGLVIGMMALDLISAGEYTFDDFLIDLKLAEDLNNDDSTLHISTVDINIIKENLKNNFPFN